MDTQNKFTEEVKKCEAIQNENVDLKNQISDLNSEMSNYKSQLQESEKVNSELKSKLDQYTTSTKTNNTSKPTKMSTEPLKETSSKNLGVSSKASSFKSYMDYRCITNKRSYQYKLIQSSVTDSNGLRKIGEYYCVAMGTYYGKLGDKFYIETDEGACWKVILADIKSDSHTNSTHQYTTANRCMMEFIVDTKKLPKSIKNSGTVNGLGFQGNIITVKKI